jgi:hypothetical protein
LFIFFCAFLIQVFPEGGVLALEVVDALLVLLVPFAVAEFLGVVFSLVVFDDLFEGAYLVLMIF